MNDTPPFFFYLRSPELTDACVRLKFPFTGGGETRGRAKKHTREQRRQKIEGSLWRCSLKPERNRQNALWRTFSQNMKTKNKKLFGVCGVSAHRVILQRVWLGRDLSKWPCVAGASPSQIEKRHIGLFSIRFLGQVCKYFDRCEEKSSQELVLVRMWTPDMTNTWSTVLMCHLPDTSVLPAGSTPGLWPLQWTTNAGLVLN